MSLAIDCFCQTIHVESICVLKSNALIKKTLKIEMIFVVLRKKLLGSIELHKVGSNFSYNFSVAIFPNVKLQKKNLNDNFTLMLTILLRKYSIISFAFDCTATSSIEGPFWNSTEN